MEKTPASTGSKDRLLPLLLLIAFIALGTWARVVNAGGSASLWFDEAWRIQQMLSADSVFRQAISPPNHIDPPVFNLAIYLLAQVHNIELVLRLVSIIPGVLAILAAYLVGRQLFTSRWTALLAAFLVTFSPWLTIFSKELKPYSLALLVHLSVLYGFLRYWRRPELRWKLLLAVTMLCALFFSPNIVFAFPGICVLMLSTALETRKWRKIAETLGIVTAMFFASSLYYIAFLRSPSGSRSFGHLIDYWRGHFCPHETVIAAAGWFFERYLAFYSELARTDFSLLVNAGAALAFIYPWMALAGAMIVLFRSRRRFIQLFCLFLMPVLVMVPFNILELWPFGPLRMNLFLMAYIIFPPLILLDEWQKSRSRLGRFLPVWLAAALLMALQYPVEFDDYSRKRTVMRKSSEALINIIEHRPTGPPIPLLVNKTGLPSFSYYSRHHETVSKLFAGVPEPFMPQWLATQHSRLYTTGVLLRQCQKSREVAIYASHYNRYDRALFRNDFSISHHSFNTRNVHSCFLTSRIAGYQGDHRPLIKSKQFAGESMKWKAVYISPPLPVADAAPGALVVVNFNVRFHSEMKMIRFRFFDQDVSRESFSRSSIQNRTVRIPDRFQSAVHTRIMEPVESIRLVVSARGRYDFVLWNVNYFVTRPDGPVGE